MTPIRFVNAWGVYAPGETAGFDDALAGSLVSAGVAVPIGAADDDGGGAPEVVIEPVEPEGVAEAAATEPAVAPKPRKA